jgi:hypothetical protein
MRPAEHENLTLGAAEGSLQKATTCAFAPSDKAWSDQTVFRSKPRS